MQQNSEVMRGSLRKEGFGLGQLLNKVPEITLYFWIIKILCTTVGETAADFLNVNLNFGLTGTSLVTGVLLAIALVFQFRSKKYIPWIYWLTVALVSVFGTLVTDNLTDAIGVPLEVSTILFAVLLGATFLVWYIKEKTLSVHSIFTKQREIFYWLAILFTFALGTASGDLMAEGLGLGYLLTGVIVAGLIAVFSIGWKLRLNSILSFWLIYIMTRPLGASIGDFLSQPLSHGGLGLGATLTSMLFVGGIIAIVTYLSVTKKDFLTTQRTEHDLELEHEEKGGMWQTTIVVGLLLIVGVTGYFLRQSSLRVDTSDVSSGDATSTGLVAEGSPTPRTSPLGDLSIFKTITQNALDLLNADKQSEATTRINDLEYEWDNAQARLKPKNKTIWNDIDEKIDTVLRELRAVHPTVSSEKAALEVLLKALK